MSWILTTILISAILSWVLTVSYKHKLEHIRDENEEYIATVKLEHHIVVEGLIKQNRELRDGLEASRRLYDK